ncbi:MAG: hypothetical protein ACRDKZ_06065, partial [Actinomycetota bacterium]
DRADPGAWLYGGSNPWAPVMIYVHRYQLSDARFVLAQVSFHSPATVPPRPRPEGRGRVPLIWWATALSLGVLLSALAIHQVAEQSGFCQLPILCEGRNEAPARP